MSSSAELALKLAATRAKIKKLKSKKVELEVDAWDLLLRDLLIDFDELIVAVAEEEVSYGSNA
jgi:hypothetical protein